MKLFNRDVTKLAATDSSFSEWHSLQGDPVELEPPRGHCNQS